MHLSLNDIVQIRPDATAIKNMEVDPVREAVFDDNIGNKDCT